MAGSRTAQVVSACPVLLDMDNALGSPVRDVDDGVALALALASPELEVVGIVASACNCSASEALANTLRMLAVAGRRDIPVARGADGPLVADRQAHHAYLDAKAQGPDASYWAQCAVSDGSVASLLPDERTGSRLIIDMARAHAGRLVLVMQGALTNLALALREAPDIAGCIREVVHMGGVFVPRQDAGRERAFEWATPDVPAEVWEHTLRFNTWYDPEATAVVLRSGMPLRLVTANVTVHVFMRLEDVARIRQSGGAWRRFLADAVEPWVRWSMERRKLPGAHMHDPLAVAAVAFPDICRYRVMHADVPAFLEGREWLLRAPEAAGGTVMVQAAVDVDVDRFEELLTDRLAGADVL